MLQLIIAATARAIEQGKQLIPRIRQEFPLSQTTARTFRIDRDNFGLSKFGLKPRRFTTALSYNGKSDNQAKN
jgi:hypothetical protein